MKDFTIAKARIQNSKGFSITIKNRIDKSLLKKLRADSSEGTLIIKKSPDYGKGMNYATTGLALVALGPSKMLKLAKLSVTLNLLTLIMGMTKNNTD